MDLSYNQLHGNTSDFLLVKGLQELYISHNNYTYLPEYTAGDGSIHTMSDLNQLTILDFSFNFINYVSSHLSHSLIKLNLSQNHIQDMSDLKDLTQLAVLDLSHNNISFDAFDGFNSAIIELYLSHNYMHVVPDTVYTAQYLRYVDLSHNGISEWPFVYNYTMNNIPDRSLHMVINLSYNSISHIWPNASWDSKIPICKILENYDILLEESPVNCDCETYRIYKYLISRSKSERPNLNTEDLPDFSFYENHWNCTAPVQWKGIPLMQIPEDEYYQMCFQNCPPGCHCYHNWEFNNPLVVNCMEHALTELPAILPDSTSHLLLQYNNITSLYQTGKHIKDLTFLDLSSNYIQEIPDFVNTQLPIEDIDRLSYPIVVNLSYNSISHIWPNVSWDSKIPIWKILKSYHILLNGNPICGCGTFRIYEYLISSSRSERPDLDPDDLPDFSFYQNRWNCMVPSKWAGIPLMQIPEHQYNTMCLHNCPEGCHCYHLWEFNNTMVVHCTEHALTEFPATVPDNTSHLLLQHNNIRSLCQTEPYFKDLKVLDLCWNSLSEICPGFFHDLTNLQELNLSNNQLEDLPDFLKELKHLTSIDISNNKFRCDCDALWMTRWVLERGSPVETPRDIACVSGQGQGKHLIDLRKDDVGCNNPLIHSLICLAVIFILTIILASVIYKYKGYIKVWLYVRFHFHPWDNIKENPQDKDYDAFVSFSRKDADLVLKILLPYLEAPQCGFHLCVQDRDFVPGATITKNITTAIKYSRRTILVLTPDFIKSGWCDFEFQTAHKRTIDDRSNFLIVVVLEKVPDKELDQTLKFYMETNTYVSVDDKWFWQKMLYAMPKVPIDKLKAQQNYKNKNNKKGGNNINDKNKNNRNGRKNRKDRNSSNAGNDRNDEKDIELGAAGGFNNEGEDSPLLDVTIEDDMPQEDVPLLKDGAMEVNPDDGGAEDVPLLNMKDVKMLEIHKYDDDVALLLDVDYTDNDHYADNNQQGNIEENVAAVHHHDHISDISISDDAVITDSDDEEFDEDQVYEHPCPCSNCNAVARLPPLFKRINTYNDVQ